MMDIWPDDWGYIKYDDDDDDVDAFLGERERERIVQVVVVVVAGIMMAGDVSPEKKNGYAL